MNKLFLSLVSNILQIDIIEYKRNDKILDLFQKEKNPYQLSKELKKEELKESISSLEEGFFYEIIDNLGERILLFRYGKCSYIAGPYISKPITEKDIEELAIKLSIPSNLIDGLKIQLFNCPIIDTFKIEDVIKGIISSIEDRLYLYEHRRINHYSQEKKDIQKEEFPDEDYYSYVYKKYEFENELLYKIEHGLTEEIKEIQKKFAFFSREDILFNYYNKNPQVAMASYRTLLRKAAEKSGISVVIIDRVISKYTQLMLIASPKDYISHITSLAMELAEEVRHYLANMKYSSPLINKVCEYIYLHYNQNISVKEIANKMNVTDYYLIHLFKKETKKTILEYREEIRLYKAKELLEDRNLTISQIANYVGYLDNNYFAKVFKDRFNISPSGYRKGL